jgi:hypothetical protein
MPCRNDCGKPGCRKDYHPGEPCSNQTKLQFDEEIVAEKARKAGKKLLDQRKAREELGGTV